MYLIINESDLDYAKKYAEKNIAEAYYRMNQNRAILIEVIRELSTTPVQNWTGSNVTEDQVIEWTQAGHNIPKGVHTTKIVNEVLSTGKIERKSSWIYDELKSMYEDGLLSRDKVITNSAEHKLGIQPGNYYYLTDLKTSFLGEIDWDEVKQQYDSFIVEYSTKGEIFSGIELIKDTGIPISGIVETWNRSEIAEIVKS